MWEAAAIFCPELDEAFPNHDAKIHIFSVTAKFQVQIEGCFSKGDGGRKRREGSSAMKAARERGARGGEARGGGAITR